MHFRRYITPVVVLHSLIFQPFLEVNLLLNDYVKYLNISEADFFRRYLLDIVSPKNKKILIYIKTVFWQKKEF